MNFKGKCAFITGVSHGIGQAIALRIAKEGASLFLCDINEEGLKNNAKKALFFIFSVPTVLVKQTISDDDLY